MCLDASMNARSELATEEERLEKIITCPEYSEDIYRYLREAEARPVLNIFEIDFTILYTDKNI